MKKIVLRKEEAEPLAKYLQDLELRNKVSRLRNKFIKKLTAIQKEMEEDRIELAKEHAELDESGEPIVNENEYKIIDRTAFFDELNSLVNEEVSIEVGDFSNNFEPLFSFLDSDSYDVLLSGVNANCYDRLLEAWEQAIDESTVEKEKEVTE